MGMLLRRRSNDDKPNMTTEKSLMQKPEAKAKEESVKDEKPKTVKRGRPTKK